MDEIVCLLESDVHGHSVLVFERNVAEPLLDTVSIYRAE